MTLKTIQAAAIDAIDKALDTHSRVMLAIAAVPTAGKSTLAAELLAHYGNDAVILPMDGFHLDNAILDRRGIRAHKGSPESFDADGFIRAVQTVNKGEPLIAPSFDRELDLSRAGTIEINHQRLVIVEGNYLLFNQSPWRDLKDIWDLSLWLEIDLEEVERRAIARWLAYGFDQAEAERRARDNDVKNAQLVMAKRLEADLKLPGG